MERRGRCSLCGEIMVNYDTHLCAKKEKSVEFPVPWEKENPPGAMSGEIDWEKHGARIEGKFYPKDVIGFSTLRDPEGVIVATCLMNDGSLWEHFKNTLDHFISVFLLIHD